MSQEIKPAATAIICRDHNSRLEVLLLQRVSSASFLPDYWVFPGGSVDPEDQSGAIDMERARAAAIRETNEEAGLTLDGTALLPYSHWTAPANLSKRFATWFFIIAITEKVEVVIDNTEIQAYQWRSPSDALTQHSAGKLQMMPPTFITLFELAKRQTSSAALEHVKSQPCKHYLPKVVSDGDKKVFLYESDHGYIEGDLTAGGAIDRITMHDNILTYHRS